MVITEINHHRTPGLLPHCPLPWRALRLSHILKSLIKVIYFLHHSCAKTLTKSTLGRKGLIWLGHWPSLREGIRSGTQASTWGRNHKWALLSGLFTGSLSGWLRLVCRQTPHFSQDHQPREWYHPQWAGNSYQLTTSAVMTHDRGRCSAKTFPSSDSRLGHVRVKAK